MQSKGHCGFEGSLEFDRATAPLALILIDADFDAFDTGDQIPALPQRIDQSLSDQLREGFGGRIHHGQQATIADREKPAPVAETDADVSFAWLHFDRWMLCRQQNRVIQFADDSV